MIIQKITMARPHGTWLISRSSNPSQSSTPGTNNSMIPYHLDELKRKTPEELGVMVINELANLNPDMGFIKILIETGRIKVFRTCKNFLEERRTYHRKDGKIVDIRDDAISAVRYAHMMLRHARTETVRRRKVAFARGASNW